MKSSIYELLLFLLCLSNFYSDNYGPQQYKYIYSFDLSYSKKENTFIPIPIPLLQQNPFSASGSSVLHAGEAKYFPKYCHYQFCHTKYVFLLLSKDILGVMSRSGICESKGKCICSFVRWYQIFREG